MDLEERREGWEEGRRKGPRPQHKKADVDAASHLQRQCPVFPYLIDLDNGEAYFEAGDSPSFTMSRIQQ